MAKHWRFAAHDPARTADLQRAVGVPALVAQLLLARGIDDADRARQFLEPKLSGLRDPELLPGVPQAADVLLGAVRAGKRIAVYGDYDADGMTATAILLRCLRLLGGDARFYVPHRMDEGYGLNDGALETLAADGVQTVVTVDNGIASLDQAETAHRLGLELVVTDHHQMAERLPRAAAVVHPQLPGFEYPFAGLCGAAVAFKLAWALCQRSAGAKRVSEPMRALLLRATGLAALGTIADVVPLVDENRILVRYGLNALREHPLPGIAALERVTKTDGRGALTGEDVGFALAPRLNAAGRLGQAELAVELLTTDSPQRAEELAAYINELNETRQTLERSVLLAARKLVKEQGDPTGDPALVLAGQDWHPGVIGIVASRLVEQHGVPVVLISLDPLGVKAGIGSGRSVPGFDLGAALAACRDDLLSCGGHAAAAGLRIDPARVGAFRRAFLQVAAERVPEGARHGELWVEAETPLAALTCQTVGQLEQLAPFGHGNRRPTLATTDVRLASPPRRMGGAGRHLSVELEQHGVRLRGVAFGQGDWEEPLGRVTGPLSIAFRPMINTFRGWPSVELHLDDWKPAEKPAALAGR